MDKGNQLRIRKSNIFDPILELKERFSNIGLKYNNGKIRINGGVYSPKFKVQSQKWAFFERIDEEEKNVLSKNGWTVIDVSKIKNRVEVNQLILELFR
ncbi:hypothetical protein [Anaerobutyricum hallii]|nr:hypothetical protein [Anaerobutyricum hallii]